jgi:predicted ribosome quality control (RQC) complex YloA/Tae2 family protein
MNKKWTDFEVKSRIDNLKSVKSCDSFEKNMEQLGYAHLRKYLSIQRVVIKSHELLDKFNFDKENGVTEKFITDFMRALAAYEEFLSSKNSRKTIANRLRQSIKKNGVKNAIIKATSKKTVTEGYDYLINAGLDEFTLEQVVLDNHELFDIAHVEFVRNKLNS